MTIMKKLGLLILSIIFTALTVKAQEKFNGLGVNLGNLYRMSDALTRSISPENFNGEKGKGGMAVTGSGAEASRALGQGWKVSPSVVIKKHTTYTVAEIDGSGAIQHIWMTPTGNWRFSILRFYWDDEATPSVEVPVGDFFCMGWGKYSLVQSLAIAVNPGSGFNCYWPMPFRKKCRITMENIDNEDMVLYYQVDYTLTEVPKDAGYFHAQFRRVNPIPFKKNYVLVDSIKGKGQYVGTYLAYGSIKTAGGARGRSNFIWTVIHSFPPLTGQVLKIIFAAHTILIACIKNRMAPKAANIQNLAVLTVVCRR